MIHACDKVYLEKANISFNLIKPTYTINRSEEYSTG